MNHKPVYMIDKKRNGWRTIFKRTFLSIDYFL